MSRVIEIVLIGLSVVSFLLHPSSWILAVLMIVILCPLISWLLLFGKRKCVGIHMEMPTVEQKNHLFYAELQVMNLTVDEQNSENEEKQKKTSKKNILSLIPLGVMKVELVVKNLITGEETKQYLLLKGTEKLELKSKYCGSLSLSVKKAWIYDWFGVFAWKIPMSLEKKVTIMSDVYPAYVEEQLHYSTLDDCQEYAPDKKGQDRSETFQIRDYVPGDPLNQIHWKLSGKWDSLIVREASFPLDRQIMLFVDESYGEIAPELADAVIAAAVSLGTALISAGSPFCLVWNNEQINTRNITEEEEWYAAVGELLNVENHKGTAATVEYEELFGIPQEGRVLYVGGTIPSNFDAFTSGAAVQSYIGTDKPLEEEGVRFFTAANLPEVLASAEG